LRRKAIEKGTKVGVGEFKQDHAQEARPVSCPGSWVSLLRNGWGSFLGFHLDLPKGETTMSYFSALPEVEKIKFFKGRSD
jgi:hypothetical protein